MLRFLRITLSLISLLVLLQACSLRYHPAYKTTEAFPVDGKDIVVDQFQKILFNTHINAFGNKASGLLLIKLMAKDRYRFVFMSQVGMKFFDVELNKGAFEVHQLISYLDTKNVRRVLKNDLQMLISKPELLNPTYFEHKENNHLLLREKGALGRMYYHYFKDQITTKEQSGWLLKNTTIEYFYLGSGLPSKILIDHKKFNLNWALYPVKRKLKSEE